VERTEGFEHIRSIIRRVLGLVERKMTHAEVIYEGLLEMEEAER